VETRSLPPEQGRELERLIGEAGFFSLPASRLTRLPDVLQYKVSVEDGARRKEITFDSESGEAALLDLVDRVVDLSGEPG